MITAFFNKIEKVILMNLKNATSSVKIAVAWFTNPRIFNLIEELSIKGVKIQLIIADEKINYTVSNKYLENLLKNGIEIRITNNSKLMHHKFCIIDDRVLISGSYNWTVNAEINNHENIILTTQMELIGKFIYEYSNLLKSSIQLKLIDISSFKEYSTTLLEEIELKLILESKIGQNEYNKLTENFVEEVPDEVQNLLKLAFDEYLTGKYEKAISTCKNIFDSFPKVAEAYFIAATCKWRQEKYQEQINNAKKAIELDNKLFSAYNILAIGYSAKGNAQKSIENYQICIDAEPDEYIYYRNRALSYIDLETDSALTVSLRNQYSTKAKSDLHKVIELTNKLQNENSPYQLYYSRGIARQNLNENYPAKIDLLKAKQVYDNSPKEERDVFEYKIIKSSLLQL